MNELSKETIGIKKDFMNLKQLIKADYEKGKLSEYSLYLVTTHIDISIIEALMPKNTLNLLELRDAIRYGSRLRLLLAEKLYNEPLADDWKTRLEECLNQELIC